MELTPQERALVESYLESKPRPDKLWLGALVLGAVVFLGSMVAMLCTETGASLLPYALVGMLVMAQALDMRRRALLVSILQKLYCSEEGTDPGPTGL